MPIICLCTAKTVTSMYTGAAHSKHQPNPEFLKLHLKRDGLYNITGSPILNGCVPQHTILDFALYTSINNVPKSCFKSKNTDYVLLLMCHHLFFSHFS